MLKQVLNQSQILNAGMLFYNDEGTELGGLVFAGGRDEQGNAISVGSLTFDRQEALRSEDRAFSNGFQPDRGLSPDTVGAVMTNAFAATGPVLVDATVDPSEPLLPAAVTTTTPLLTSRSTSTQSGLCPQANICASKSYPTLRLTPCTRSTLGSSFSSSRT